MPEERIHPASLLAWTARGVTAFARPVVDAEHVYFLDSFEEHTVTAVNKRSGTVVWKRDLTFTYQVGPLDTGRGLGVVDGVLVVSDAEVFGLDPATGALRWHYARRPERDVNPFSYFTADAQTVYCYMDSKVTAIKASTGQVRWIADVWPGRLTGGRIAQVADTVVYVAALSIDRTRRSGVVAMSARTGEPIWATELETPGFTLVNLIPGVGIVDTTLVVPLADGTVHLLDRSTGLTKRILPRSVFSPPSEQRFDGETYYMHVDTQYVYITSSNGRVTALDRRDWSTKWSRIDLYTGGTAWDIVSDDLYLYVATGYGGGGLAVRDKQNGTLKWYITLDDFPTGEQSLNAPGLDGEMVYWGGNNSDSYAFRRR